ncbi:MAG TPA: polyprenol monophosphomannose synthase [Chloroflexi bacterium]|nr:polyprenol monophosphomannose synthase [Chloroflexota bacterium]
MRDLTVVIPTYNEAENLPLLANALWKLPIPDLKILVVDDASPDGTGQIADALAERNPGRINIIHRSGKLGLGTAYITGFMRALEMGAEAVAQMDADFSHSPEYLPSFMELLESCDLVIGSRYVPGGRLDERWGAGRVLLSWFGNFYARTILRLKVRDATGGFRLWKRQTLERMPLDRIRSNGYVFQIEMAYVAQRLGFRIRETPIYFEDRRIGQSKMSLRIQMEAAFRVWHLLWMHRTLRPLDKPMKD